MGIFDWFKSTPRAPNVADVRKSFSEMQKTRAEKGFPDAQWNFGIACIEGQGVTKNEHLGLHWIKEAALQGDLNAQVFLGKVFALGLYGRERNDTLAVEALLAAVSAHHDSVNKAESALVGEAIQLLGFIYVHRRGPSQHLELVKSLLVSQSESIPSNYYLGSIFLGELNSDDGARVRAGVCFSLMIQNDIRNAKTLSELAGQQIELSYADAESKPIDLKACLPLVFEVAKDGNPDARFTLGLVLLRGWRGVAEDKDQAYALLSSAAEQGHQQALELTMKAFPGKVFIGLDVKSTVAGVGEEAIDVQKIMTNANSGDAQAQFDLGYIYQLGRGLEQDLEKAEIWYLHAAAQGHELARLNLRSISPVYRD